ncbi:MAG TPA: hypothetical protein VIL60_06420 [Rhodanobacter sp.]
MDEQLKQGAAGSTQRLLADRLRQRYARCRETLASYASEADAPSTETSVRLRLIAARNDPAPAQAGPSDSDKPFATLFSQAYSAARDSRNNTPIHTHVRARQRATA